MNKKYPFDKIIFYMLMARNSHKSISMFLEHNGYGKVDGKNFRSYESHIRSLCTPKMKLELDKKPTTTKRKPKNKSSQVRDSEVVILTSIPSKLKGLAVKVGVGGNPFAMENVVTIATDKVLKRTIEVYLTSKMNMVEVVKIVNEKFRMNITIKDISEYRRWFYDISNMGPEKLYEYFDSLGKTESEYKRMAYMNKPDFVRWKMRDDFDIDPKEAVRKIMAESYFTLNEMFNNSDRISHNAVKTWTEICFKAMDQMKQLDLGSDKADDVFANVRFVLSTGAGSDDVVPYSDLIEMNKDKNED